MSSSLLFEPAGTTGSPPEQPPTPEPDADRRSRWQRFRDGLPQVRPLSRWTLLAKLVAATLALIT
ncbi:MAG: hypothetical protein ACTHJJ_04640, partial [Intrasporangium sp.]